MVSNKLKKSLSLGLALTMMTSSVAMAAEINIAETNKTIEEIQGKINHINDEKLKGSLQTSLDRIEAMLNELEKEPALKEVTVKNEFGVTKENLRFMVKSITNGKGGQAVATLEDVNDHFNKNYEVKNGYKLEVEVTEENKLMFKTYMTEELFAEIKGKDGADLTTPYRITVLKGQNKKEDKIIKLAYTKDDVTFIYVAVEDLEKLIAELPEVGKVSLENKEKVAEIRADYKALGEEKQALVKKELVEKLVALEEKLVELEKDLALKVVTVKNEFGATKENLRFMVKSITNGKGGQAVATLEDVNDHFNKNYEVKNGYKLEVEVTEENKLMFKTYMTEELFAEIKGKDGADLTTPYRITVLKGENKKEDKIIKLAYTKDDVTFIYVAVEDLEKLIAELPSLEELTLENKEKVEEARAAYEALNKDQQRLVSEEVVELLKTLENKIEEIKEKPEEPKYEAVTYENVGISVDSKFLVYEGQDEKGQSIPQTPKTLEEVKTYIDKTYNVNFNKEVIKLEAGKITITEKILSEEDWDKIKTNGNKEIPYRITILKGSDKKEKVVRLAISRDGKVAFEEIKEK